MGKARLEKQLIASCDNKVGKFADVTAVLAEAKVNLKAICAWGMEGKAYFAFLTSDNVKASSGLKSKGFKVEEHEAVAVNLEDKIGAAAAIAKKIKAAGIDLEYVYGTTCGCKDSSALLVLESKENAKLVSVING